MSHSPGLFPEPDEQAARLLDQLGRAINRAAPLKGKHRSELPYAIRDLSRSLTEEREGRPKEYMGAPRTFAAYLRYFLPWNVYRMTRLFAGMNLNVPEGGTVVDLGAGPLTVLLSLWIARPHLRDKELTFVCLDRTPKPMKTGLEVFRALAHDAPWKVSLVKGGIHTKLRERADLLTAANTLNELDWRGGEQLLDQMEQTARSLRNRLAEGGRMLLIEPGVRDASRLLSMLRAELLGQGMAPLAPCPHMQECPMPGAAGKPWCHFRFSAASAPDWLKKLAGQARLPKEAASLSFLHLTSEPFQDRGVVRAVSEPFPLPEGQGQYACSARGLTLIGYRRHHTPLAPGAELHPRWPEQDIVDEKSGALILPLVVRAEEEHQGGRGRP